MKTIMSQKFFPVLAALLSVGVACSLAQASSIYIGNPLTNNGATDGDAPFVILGEYNAAAPTATSTINFPGPGEVTSVQVYDRSAGQNFDAYILQPAGTDIHGNQQFKIIDSSGTLTTSGTGVETFALASPWIVSPGDLIGFWGTGPTYATGTYNDAGYANDGNYTASEPTLGTTYSFGISGSATSDYQYFPNGQDPRIYSIGVDFVATPEPSSVVALCGLGAMGLFLAARRRRKS
jgi:hypothetical protein